MMKKKFGDLVMRLQKNGRFPKLFIMLLIAGAGTAGVMELYGALGGEVEKSANLTKALEKAVFDAQRRAIRENKEEIALLREALAGTNDRAREEAKEVLEKLSEQEKARKQIEAEKILTEKKITELERDLANAKPADLTAIIRKWRKRVAHIACMWQRSGGSSIQKTGSGFLFGSDFIATSKHVVLDDGVAPNSCKIQFPDDPTSLILTRGADTGKIIADINEDFAWIQVKTPTIQMKSQNTHASLSQAVEAVSCKTRAVAGDSMVILGYPNIGSETDVTATEGIISGYESYYYITSAKLEHGNSGGAAIAAKNDCYLGIPTFVRVGNIESLGRILDFSKIYP